MSKRKSHDIEASIVATCKKQCIKYGLDTNVWQAGTRSDFGHRPIEQKVDLWLPVQAKTTMSTCRPYRFFVRGEYQMDIACMPGHRAGAYVFSEEFMRKNKDKLYSGKCIYITPGSVFDTKLLKWPSYSKMMAERWHVEFDAHVKDVDAGRTGTERVSRLRTEMELRMQCSENSKKEVATQMLIMSVTPERKHEWHHMPNGHVDRVVDGLRVQDKVALPVKSGAFQSSVSKKVSGKQVPYSEVDADVFCFAVIHERLKLLLLWEITSIEMKRMGILSTKTSPGRTSAVLAVASPDGTNASLEKAMFGPKKYSGSARETGRFLKVYQLPEGYQVPQCMRGRDP